MEQDKQKKTAEDLIIEGNKFRKEGKLESAIASYKEGIKIDANSYECYHVLGETLAQRKQLNPAIEAYKQAIKINPQYSLSYHCLGLVYFQQKKLHRAIDSWHKAINIEPNQAIFHYQLGRVFQEKGEFNEAIQCYTKALSIDTNCLEAQRRLNELSNHQTSEENNVISSDSKLEPQLENNLTNISSDQQNNLNSTTKVQTKEQITFPSMGDFLNQYPGIADLSQISSLKICIATPDFVGFVKNGGIGTSFFHTAKIFSQHGAKVSVLYCNKVGLLTTEEQNSIIKKLSSQEIEIIDLLSEYDNDIFQQFHPRDIFTVSSYLSYKYLKEQNYDIILFPEWRGMGYYSALAKKQRIAFENTAICIQTHSSSLWHALNNQAPSFSQVDLRVYRMERGSVQYADFVTSPTQYLVNWKLQHGFEFPENTYVQPYLLEYKDVERKISKINEIDEIVFFGRLEKRKGIHHFMNAIKKVSDDHKQKLKITFLGKFGTVEQVPVIQYIKDNLDNQPIQEIKMLPILNHEEAINYLKSTNSVAFIGSVADNSPLTVLECLHYGIPFIASDVGGIPELIEEKYHQEILFRLHPAEIARKIEKILEEGHIIVPPKAIQKGNNIDIWLNTFLTIQALTKANAAQHQLTLENIVSEYGSPTISICITHYNREVLLRKTFEGLKKQTFKDFEIIIVDDGSTDENAKSYLEEIASGKELPNCRVIYQQNQYVGAARNKALAIANAPFVVFMDDDNYAKSNQLETFLLAIVNSGFDALSCCAIAFDEEEDPAKTTNFQHIYLPLGSGASVGILQNSYGDANGIFRKEAIQEVGGYTEDYGISWEDYELFAKLDIEGYKIGVIPEPLMWLRSTKGSVSRRGSMVPNYYRALRPLFQHFPWHTFGDALLLTVNQILQGMHHREQIQETSPSGLRKLLAHSADNGYVAVRHGVAYLLEQEDRNTAESMLLDVATYNQESRFLLWDWACLKIMSNEALEAIAILDSRFTQDWIDLKIIKSLLTWFISGEIEPLISHLEIAVQQKNNSLPYQLALGRLYSYCGISLAKSLLLLGSLLDSAEQTYLSISPDLVKAIEEGHLISGINHYIIYGQYEKRPFKYYQYLINPFVEIENQAIRIEKYQQKFSQAYYQSDTNQKVLQLGSLFKECLNSHAVLETFEVSRTLLQTAETDYIKRHPDLRKLKPKNHPYPGIEHFIKHGEKEKRSCLLRNLDIDDFTSVLNKPSQKSKFLL